MENQKKVRIRMEIVDIYTLSVACMVLFYTMILIAFYEILRNTKKTELELTPKQLHSYLKEIEKNATK